MDKAWEDIQEEFKASNKAEVEELSEHFNDCIEGLRIGDALFTNKKADFISRMEGLNVDELEKFIEALRLAEIFEFA